MKLIINPLNSSAGLCYRQRSASCDVRMALHINTPPSKVRRTQAPLVKLLCVCVLMITNK